MNLIDFLLARIAEDEAAARAVPPLGHNYDMGGNRQDERFTFDRTLPSSADGMANSSEHRGSPTTAAHFSRHDPSRVLVECAAKRHVIGFYEAALDLDRDAARGLGRALRALATVHADHPDYRQEWGL